MELYIYIYIISRKGFKNSNKKMRTKIYIKIIEEQILRDEIEKKNQDKYKATKRMRITNKNKMGGLWLGHHKFQ